MAKFTKDEYPEFTDADLETLNTVFAMFNDASWDEDHLAQCLDYAFRPGMTVEELAAADLNA